MAEITLTATTDRPIGTRASRRLRNEGKVPAVVYGLGEDTVSVAVNWRELRLALTTDAGFNALIDLEVEGTRQLTIVKELQRHPVTAGVVHVDFLRIRADQEITVDVPVLLTGDPEALTREQGMVEHLMSSLAIAAKPGDIPDELTFDISDLTIGDTVTVADLALPTGVTTDVDLTDVVASAQVSQAALAAEEIAEADAEIAAERAEEEGEAEGGVPEEAEAEGGEPEGGDGEDAGEA